MYARIRNDNYDDENIPSGAYRSTAYERTQAFLRKGREMKGQKQFTNKNKPGFKPRSNAGQNRSSQRQDNFRSTKGNERVEALVTDFKKTLLVGFDSMEEVIRAHKYESLQMTIPLPISTRTVGFSVQEVFTSVTRIPHNVDRLPPVTVHQIYRVCLGMIEFKIYQNRITSSFEDAELWYPPQLFEAFKNTITSINVAPQRIRTMLLSIGKYSYDEGNYVPTLPRAIRDVQNRVIPCAELVTLTNLRDYVNYLADPDSVQEIRQQFYLHSPLPRARWNVDNFLLLNGDEIIPQNYDTVQLSDDVFSVKEWIEIASELKGAKNKWFGEIKLHLDDTGNESSMVSCSAAPMRCADAGQMDNVIGDANRFWWPVKMPETLATYGIYGLMGEIPSIASYVYPYYALRTRNVAKWRTDRSYKDIVRVVEM